MNCRNWPPPTRRRREERIQQSAISDQQSASGGRKPPDGPPDLCRHRIRVRTICFVPRILLRATKRRFDYAAFSELRICHGKRYTLAVASVFSADRRGIPADGSKRKKPLAHF
jgi:hypothetical protein